MTSTEQFVCVLATLKAGDLGRLRKLAGQPLDESLDGFDLFTGLWWPQRRESAQAPRRQVAWLVAKLYAFRPMPQSSEATLAKQLGGVKCANANAAQRVQLKFDELLALPLDQIEPALQWAISRIANHGTGLDWVRLTDELSMWEREQTRVRWAEEYLRASQ